ncbi:MAG: heparan-alpha-glucosaminide N-acetyltransferase domain-containing protein [Pseudomonadota bacterium]
MPQQLNPRIASIDIMRGLVILLMMLDHVRERFYMHVRTGDPIFESVEPDLFITRSLTHLCAPVFIFLAGLSAWLYAHPPNGPYRSPTGFLFKRGLVLIAFEVVFYYLVWADTIPDTIYLQVLWAIGVSMLGLAVVCRMNRWAIGALGLLIVVGHNALTPVEFSPGELGYIPWSILHDQNNLFEIGGLTIRASYPVLPWFGVIALGYFAGPLFAPTVSRRDRGRALLILGLSCLALLLVLRGFNIYGEALPWSPRDSAAGTVMAFLNFTKYPPSLDYLLMTLGVGLLLLTWVETLRRRNWLLDAMQVYGSVPMFAYFVHLYVLLAAYWILYLMVGPTHGERFGLANVGWIWVGAIALAIGLYRPAKAFAAYKHREKHSKPWLSYL